ncbi:MAG: glycoside hydrolase family 2 protein [Candidatus Helarchaeota archaeon]
MKISLNSSDWRYRCDPDALGERENWHDPGFIKKRWDELPTVSIPSCWNTILEKGKYPYDRYIGYFWFFSHFVLKNIDDDHTYYISFKAINYYCKIWINGTYLGDHEGGFLPFKLRIPTKILEEMNFLTVTVENYRRADRLPALFFDWYHWGGIFRDVDLEILPKERVEWAHITTKELLANSAILFVECKLTQKGRLTWKILQNSTVIKQDCIDANGKKLQFLINVPDPQLWSVKNPTLYEFQAQLNDSSEIYSTKFGIRTISVGPHGIYLNGHIIKLRGVSLHEELMPYGRSIPRPERAKDLHAIKKLGFNTLRTAHYSHDETLLHFADKIGLLVLEEIPVYWNCDFKNPNVLKLAAKMLRSLIFRDFNHPSVILWSVGNEIPVEHKACYDFIDQLMRYGRKLDSSRIITYVSSRMVSDRLRKNSDLPCLNIYFGWYLFSERNLNRVLDLIHATASNQPLLITEFGAGAKYGFHSADLLKFSEEKQASILSESILTFNSKNYIAGWIIWIYRDFRSPIRTNRYQQGFNRKGIVSDKNEPKLITRFLRDLIKKIPHKRRMGWISKMYWVFIPIELFVFGLLYRFFENVVLRGQFEKYYSNIPQKKID